MKLIHQNYQLCESKLLFRLSPITNTQPSGTICNITKTKRGDLSDQRTPCSKDFNIKIKHKVIQIKYGKQMINQDKLPEDPFHKQAALIGIPHLEQCRSPLIYHYEPMQKI